MGITIRIRKMLKCRLIFTMWSICGDKWIWDRLDIWDRNPQLRTVAWVVTEFLRGIFPTMQIYLICNEVRIRQRSCATRLVGPITGV